MDKRKQIIELIKEDSWHNIPVENTVDKIFSILGIEREKQVLSLADVRQRFLSLCQKQAGWDGYDKLTEETEFYRVCKDGLDFVELVMRCEKEFNIKLDDFDLNEDSFDKVKDFIDWASLNVA